MSDHNEPDELRTALKHLERLPLNLERWSEILAAQNARLEKTLGELVNLRAGYRDLSNRVEELRRGT